jgi:hypothetical protein
MAVARSTKVCLVKDKAEERVIFAHERADSQEGAEACRPNVHDLKEVLAERLARTWYDNEDDEIADAPQKVVERLRCPQPGTGLALDLAHTPSPLSRNCTNLHEILN